MRFIDRTAPPDPLSIVEREEKPLFVFVRELWEREIVRYLIGGGVNTVFTYALYLLILLISVWEVANTVSYVVGIFSAYFINARYVFRQPLKWSKAVQFPLVYLLQYIVMMALSALLINALHIPEAIAPAIVTFITIPITFLATRFLLKPRPSADRSNADIEVETST